MRKFFNQRTFAQLGGFLLELLDGSLVDTTTLVDQVAGGGGLAGIDMADDDDVTVEFSRAILGTRDQHTREACLFPY